MNNNNWKLYLLIVENKRNLNINRPLFVIIVKMHNKLLYNMNNK